MVFWARVPRIAEFDGRIRGDHITGGQRAQPRLDDREAGGQVVPFVLQPPDQALEVADPIDQRQHRGRFGVRRVVTRRHVAAVRRVTLG